MKAKVFLAIAAVALLAIGCSQKNETVPEKTKGIAFKTTVKPAATKALTDNGTSLSATWAVNETIALIYVVNGLEYVNSTATITEVSSNGVATIEATLDDRVTDGTDVELIYPASAVTSNRIPESVITEQDGTLSSARDIRCADGILKVDGSTASLQGGVVMLFQNAICKFTTKDADGANDLNVSELVIKDIYGNPITTVTPATPTNVLYVTIPETEVDIWFEATVSDKPYIAKAHAKLLPGKFYAPTLKLATVGNVIGADGKFYKRKSDAVAAGTLVSAVIVYLGENTFENNYTHGLAVSTCVAGGGTKQWATTAGPHNANQYINYINALQAGESGSALSADKDNETNFPAFYNAIHNNISNAGLKDGCTRNPPYPGASNWFLPSVAQLNQIIKSVNGQTTDLTTLGNSNLGFRNLDDLVKDATQSTSGLLGSWSGENHLLTSTEYDSSHCWQYVFVSSSKTGALGYTYKTNYAGYVVATLAF
ncbi:MAG: hypothetical protein IK041_02690 [Bacteroidales bacterium]|nr:hypothetical protein [Bacteroidales bacterium]